jgi:hypothetical protein
MPAVLKIPQVQFPINFDQVRIALIRQLQMSTALTAVMFEPESQNNPRPGKPYFTMKFLSPAIKKGDDGKTYSGQGNIYNIGGQRKMVVDFNCYGNSHEQAYSYMSAWQSALETENVQADLRAAGIALWLNGNVLDLSALLNTGFEGRCHMEVSFGVAANVYEDTGEIDKVTVTGVVTSDQNEEFPISITGPTAP